MVLQFFVLFSFLGKDFTQGIDFRLVRELLYLLLLLLFEVLSALLESIKVFLFDVVLVVKPHCDLLIDAADLCPGHAPSGQGGLLEASHLLLVVELYLGRSVSLFASACITVGLFILLHPFGCLFYVLNAGKQLILVEFPHRHLEL